MTPSPSPVRAARVLFYATRGSEKLYKGESSCFEDGWRGLISWLGENKLLLDTRVVFGWMTSSQALWEVQYHAQGMGHSGPVLGPLGL